MYINQKKEERMSYLGAHEVKLTAGKSRARGSLKRFSPTCLPNFDVLPSFLPPKNIRKPKLDSTCLMAFGFLKSGKLMNLPYFEHSVSAGHPSGIDDPFTRHLDISRYLTMYPSSTYYYKVSGCSMVNAGINH